MKAGWKTKRLDEVCTLRPPKSEARKKLTDTDLVSFAPMDDLGIDCKYLNPKLTRSLGDVAGSYTYFANGDVLLAKITPCFENGKLGIAHNLINGIGFGSSEYFVIRPCHEISAEYLYYFLLQESFREEGAKSMTGAVGHKRVAKEFLEAHRIPIPLLPEQQRIVAILDEAFEAIAAARANAEQNRQNARALFESYLQSVFSQRGDRWVETTIGNQVDFLAGFAFKSTQYTESKDGIRLIRGDNIVQGQLRWDGVKYLPRANAENYSQFYFEENDIVLAMDRPWVAAGLKVAYITNNDLPALQVQRTARLRVKPNIHWKYLFHMIRSSKFVTYLLDGQTGLGVPHISGKQILSFEFAMPPLNQQQLIVQKLDALGDKTQRLESLYQRKITALDELKQSLLQQAFSGQL